MSLPVVWLPEARAELADAIDRYHQVHSDLARRFADAIVQTVERIAQAPLRYADVGRGRRRAAVRRFPYGLIFLPEESRVVVIACFHGRRHPRHWQSRQGIS